MPAAARESIDYVNGSTGIIQVTGSPTFFIEGKSIAHGGSTVTPHGSHTGTITMVQGSSTFSVAGNKVCRVGDQASCLDTVSVGSTKFFIGS